MKDFSLNDAFKNLRKMLRKSQTQFAALLGCSRETVISVENRRNGISEAMTALIKEASGAKLKRNGKICFCLTDHPYELKHYEMWCERYNALNWKGLAKHCNDWLTMMFEAAALPGFAGKNSPSALHESFMLWAERATNELKLGAELDRLLQHSLEKTKDPMQTIIIASDWNPRWPLPWHKDSSSKSLKGMILTPHHGQPRVQNKPSRPSASGARRPGGRKPSR